MGCFDSFKARLKSRESMSAIPSSSSLVVYDPANPPKLQAPLGSSTCCNFQRDDLRPPCYSDSVHPGAHRHLRLSEKPAISDDEFSDTMKQAVVQLEQTITSLNHELRQLSLEMHAHPEIMWQERQTHDLFAKYFETKPGWKLTRHAYGLETAFEAKFQHKPRKNDSRVIGFQSELDALPGIGHACGHNLIAISGVAAALSVAEVLVKQDVSGTVILLGTPAEEGGGGKIRLLEAGAYKSMDACLMVHPAPLSGTGAMLAVRPVRVTYKGRTAHAGAAPWEGVNALDAAVLAYNNISVLRQQMHPSNRVHGIIVGNDWASNVIPGESTLLYNVRSPTISGLKQFVAKVQRCFDAAALATGCEIECKWDSAYADVHNVGLLSSTYATFLSDRYHLTIPDDDFQASTDFGNVTYALPALHAEYAIHLDDPNTQGNHTVGFTKAAKSLEAHERTMEVALAIAVTGSRILIEKDYRDRVWHEWKLWRSTADGP